MLQVKSRQFAKEQGLYACIQCGKCTGGCPMAIKTRLNPRSLIYRFLVASNGFNLEGQEEIWDCTTCATCSTRCPKQVNPMMMMVALRSMKVEKGKIHPNVKTALESIFRYGNPLNMPREDRAMWANDLDVKTFAPGMDYLYFVGCTPAYDPRVQRVTRALVALLKESGLNFGILGEEESCCGSEARRLGEAGLFEMIVEETRELFETKGVEKIITTSPHCFNSFRKDYIEVGGDSETRVHVEHYTQVLNRLLLQGKLKFTRDFDRVVTYHDPCYLGKHNQVFDEPREVLNAVPGLQYREMDRSRERSLCCEGGGGRMWLEGTNPEVRLAQMRVHEAVDTGASILATACPFCLLTLEEAVKHLGFEERIKVMDIAEIVVSAI